MAEQHEFKPTARFLALYAAATVILCVVLAVAWPPFPTMLVVATPIGSTWGFYSAISLRACRDSCPSAFRLGLVR